MIVTAALRQSSLAYETKTGVINEVEYLVSGVPLPTGAHIIAFRGTEFTKLITACGIIDVIRDLTIRKVKDPVVGRAHLGFLKGAQDVCHKKLIPAYPKGMKVWLVGHSMGGSVALCAAPILMDAGWDVQGVITFGAPAALSRHSAKNYPNIYVKQYILRGDPVPMMPPKCLNFAHVNTEVIGPSCWLPSIIRKHLLKNYIRAIKSAKR